MLSHSHQMIVANDYQTENNKFLIALFKHEITHPNIYSFSYTSVVQCDPRHFHSVGIRSVDPFN